MPRSAPLLRPLVAACAVASLVLGAGSVSGCKREAETPPAEAAPAPVERAQVEAATAADIQELGNSTYARGLAAQLDLVASNADAYLVVRDLRPLLDQARRVQQVMVGPLPEAVAALAQLGGGSGEARLAQLQRGAELLALVIAGLEAAGVRLDQGLVVSQGQAGTVVVFAAEDLGRLGALAALVGGGEGGELSERCAGLHEPGWFACSLEDPEALAAYAPAGQGQALVKRLGDRLAGVELDALNVALSVAEGAQPLDVGLRTDPGLWELSMPAPLPTGSDSLLARGPAPALRALVPGTSFVWMRADPEALGEAAAGPLGPEILTGELWFGAFDAPAGLVAQAGINSASAASMGLEAVAGMLPKEPVEPEGFEDLKLELDRASIDLDGARVPSIGVRATGSGAEGWAEALGVEPRARVWAHGDYLGVGLGQVQALPAALGRLAGEGPSAEAVAALPATLARALVAGEVGLAFHLVLDHWQAPLSEAELDALLAGLPQTSRPSAQGISAAFVALAPWSSVSLWLQQGPATQGWLAHLSLVPFAAAAPEPGATQPNEETLAAAAVLDAVLAREPGAEAGYRELLDRFPGSAHAPSYRARLGEAPSHHAAVGMVELGVVAALAVPAFTKYLRKAKSSEAPAQTQSILSAALATVERSGSCDAVLGEAKLTPPLSVACHGAEGGRCRASAEASEGDPSGRYPLSAWTEDPIWSALGYQPRAPGGHRFHYGFVGEAQGKGCRLRVQAYGDLDGDGQYSTYEREATIAADGTQELTPLRIDHEGE